MYVTSVTHGWLVLTFQLPARPTAARMRVWRQLQRLGALPLKGGAYLLPSTAQTREDFEWLRAEIAAGKGEAVLLAADPVDAETAAQLAAQLRAAREADFAALARDADAVQKRRTASLREIGQLAERLAHLQSIDFFGAASAGAAADAVAAAARRPGGPRLSTESAAPALKPIAASQEFWHSWLSFHPATQKAEPGGATVVKK